MLKRKSTKLLFAISLVASIPLAGCGDNGEPTKPIVVDSLKTGLVALNTTNNYTYKCTGNRIATHTRTYTKDSIGLAFEDASFKQNDKIFYQDGDNGVYSIVYNGTKYVGSTYYNDISKDVWSGSFFKTLKDVETDYVNSIDATVATLSITNKTYRTAFLKSIGYSAMDYSEMGDLKASFNDGKLYFKMTLKSLDYNFVYYDFGTSKNYLLETFLGSGGKSYQFNEDHEALRSRFKMNNYEQYIYNFGETEETTGFVGKNYFHQNYFYTNYFSSLLASGYVALDGSKSQTPEQREIVGCYSCVLDYNEGAERPLSISPFCLYEKPDMPYLMNYPSNLSIWDHMEYFTEWNSRTFNPITDYKPVGKSFMVIDENMVYEIQDNFGIRSAFEGAIPLAVGFDFYTDGEGEEAEDYIVVLCKFSYGPYSYTMPCPFTNFGKVSNSLLDAAIKQIAE